MTNQLLNEETITLLTQNIIKTLTPTITSLVSETLLTMNNNNVTNTTKNVVTNNIKSFSKDELLNSKIENNNETTKIHPTTEKNALEYCFTNNISFNDETEMIEIYKKHINETLGSKEYRNSVKNLNILLSSHVKTLSIKTGKRIPRNMYKEFMNNTLNALIDMDTPIKDRKAFDAFSKLDTDFINAYFNKFAR